MRIIFRLFLLFILGLLLYRIIRKALFPSRSSRNSKILFKNKPNSINEMVQDPQCGLYITKKEAYADKIGTKLVYFCSKECYQKYLQDNQNKGVKK